MSSEKKIIVDCDGVIADKNHGGDYAQAGPLQHGIDQVNAMYDLGYEITLYTARYGDRANGNIHLQYEMGYTEWIDWLKKHKVKYHHAFMGKPAGVLYIDDNDSGWHQVWVELHELKHRDKYGNKVDK